MPFKLTFATENDAFEEDGPGEVACILRRVAEQIEAAGRDRNGLVYDSRGKPVGSYFVAFLTPGTPSDRRPRREERRETP